MAHNQFTFDEEALKQAENDNSDVEIYPFQEQAAIQMGKIINQYLNMNVIALRGFWYHAVKAWQEETGKFLKDTMTATLEERIEVISSILTHLEEILGRILREPAQKKELAKVFPEVLEFYKAEYGDRSHLNLSEKSEPNRY